MEFSAVFFLLILAAIMVTIIIAKMLKLLKIWKIDTDLKVKYTSLRPCDAFLLEISDVTIKASLALFIRLSHFYTQNWQSESEYFGSQHIFLFLSFFNQECIFIRYISFLVVRMVYLLHVNKVLFTSLNFCSLKLNFFMWLNKEQG